MLPGVKPYYCYILLPINSNSNSIRMFILLWTFTSKIKKGKNRTILINYSLFFLNRYRLVPMGSFSRVEKVDGDTVLSYEL